MQAIVSQAATDFIALPETSADEERDEQVFNATLRGTPLELWAGELDIALGVEYRRDKSSFTPSESILSGDSLFFGADVASSGVITVKEAFAKLRIPLLQGDRWARYQGLEAGLRFSDYNIIDDNLWTWKLGGEWHVTDGFRLRSMYNKAIRAPGVTELFQECVFLGNFFALGPFFDQCSASRDPVGNGASLGLSFLATYYLEAGVQASPLSPFLDCAGNFGPLCGDFVFEGALPELRTNTRLSYRSGSFAASLRWLRIGEMKNSENEIRSINNRPPAILAVPQVAAQDYFDLTLQQDLGENFDLSLGISNLFDEDPPFLGSANRDANTDPTTYDVLGRRFFLRFTARY